jgi:chain length determinant protein (polysaccharide antigen chain regulator)
MTVELLTVKLGIIHKSIGLNHMNDKTKQTEALPPPQYYQQPYPDDEIDLGDLFRVLIRQKRVILLVTAVITLGALFFAFRQPVIYQARIFFKPPTQADVALLNEQLGGNSAENTDQLEMINNLTIGKDELFQMFLAELGSRNLRREVFAENYLLEGQELNVDQAFNGFNERIKLHFPDKKKDEAKSDTVFLTFEDKEPKVAADILNLLGEKADRQAVKIAMLDAEGKINVKKKTLNKNIDILLTMKKKEISDEIARLQEADTIRSNTLQRQIVVLKEQAARKRGDRIALLEEAAYIANRSQVQNPFVFGATDTSLNETLAKMQISMNNLPLFMYGEKALMAEIKSLQERDADEPFIATLRDLEEQLKLLERNETMEALKERKDLVPFLPEVRDIEKQLALLAGINFDQKMIRATIVDQAAYPPGAPMPTKSGMIVALGLVLGLLAGIFTAFFVNFVESMRQKEA